MITLTAFFKNNAILALPDISAVYGDEISIVLKQVDKYGVAVNFSSETIAMNFALKNESALLLSVTATKSANSASFDIDTSDLPTFGEYKFQSVSIGSNNATFAIGNLKLTPKIE